LNEPIEIRDADNVLGIDESGKGDFFGPLVIAGVLADRAGSKKLVAGQVRDSKKISDSRIMDLSRWIKDNFIHTVVVIGPEKYNQLYLKIRNLNRLLAWGHSRVIENIASRHKFDLAVSDKFGNDAFIENALMKNGKQVRLHQMVRGEALIPVAAASIVARAEFVGYLKKMSGQFGVDLPKGAGPAVDEAARRIVARSGAAMLDKIAKIHFKNYKKALS
jgi:ribonuclease HIII